MAFTIDNFTCVSSSTNEGQLTVTPYLGVATLKNAPNLFVYKSPTDAVAGISAANYFLSIQPNLKVGDIILGAGTDAAFNLRVLTSTPTGVTVGI